MGADFTHKLMRVMESLRSAEGDESVFDYYWECGRRIHHDGDRGFSATDVLEAVGQDTSHAEAYFDDSWDTEIRSRMDEGLALVGHDVGTPIISFDDSNGVTQGIFGPVITRVPSSEDSLALWDAMITMTSISGFWELKRTRTERPDFGARP